MKYEIKSSCEIYLRKYIVVVFLVVPCFCSFQSDVFTWTTDANHDCIKKLVYGNLRMGRVHVYNQAFHISCCSSVLFHEQEVLFAIMFV